MLKYAAALAGALLATPVHADSFWNHNGSVMRLSASGGDRYFHYETPRPRLPVSPGTLLFNGRREGDRYVGTARVFSKYCAEPLKYAVAGPIVNNGLRIVMVGKRKVFAKGCVDTGRIKTDRLVFDYLSTE